MLSSLFIDTGAFLALIDPKDTFHEPAVEFYQSLPASVRQFTSWPIVAETYTWLRYHLGAVKAMEWLKRFEEAEKSGVLQVLYPEPDLDLWARRFIYRFDDQRLSYTDALSLAILQARTDIDVVFAFDHHMTLTGTPVLPGVIKTRGDRT